MRKVSMLVAGVAMIAVSAPRSAQAQDKDIVETAGKVMAAEAFKTQGKGVRRLKVRISRSRSWVASRW